jgi:hypothetical protein
VATSSEVRWVIQLRRAEDGRVEGVLTQEGADQGEAFSGWVDLLWRLEALLPLIQPDTPASD